MKPTIGSRISRAVDRFASATRALTMPASATGRRSVFKAGEVSRLAYDWIVSTIKPDHEVRRSARLLRGRARQLRRDVPIIARYLELLTVNVIGAKGVALRAQVRKGEDTGDAPPPLDARANRAIENAWKRWAAGPVTDDGKLNFSQLQRLVLETAAIDGEAFVRMVPSDVNPFGFAFQVFDADQIDETYNVHASRNQNEVRMGVEVDKKGRPVTYWAWDYDSSFDEGFTKRVGIPAAEMLHIYRPYRPNQTRGVTWLHTIMWILRQLFGYIEAEVVAARTESAKMAFFVKKDGAEGELGEDEKDETGKPLPLTMEAAPGHLEELPPGVTLETWDPQHPGGTFDPFVKACIRLIASGLGVSYHALANDLVEVNFSSIRAGLIAQNDRFRETQDWWIASFPERVYLPWMRAAQLHGQIPGLASRLSTPYQAHVWTARGWPWVDPLKDVTATALGIAQGLTSRTKALDAQGMDFDEVMEDLAHEQEVANAKGVLLYGPPHASATVAADAGGQGQGDGSGDGSGDGTGDGSGDGSGSGSSNGRGSNGHAPVQRNRVGRFLRR